MSMVARTNPGPAEDDITDTDDGDTRISAGAFWPDIVLRELRLAIRLPGRVTTSRLLHTATGAVAHVTRELEAWQQEQQAAGHQTLADVPAAKVVALLFLVIMTPDSNRMVMVFWMFTLIVSEYSVFRMELLLLLKTFRQVIVKSSRYPAPTPPQRMQRLIYGVLQPVQ